MIASNSILFTIICVFAFQAMFLSGLIIFKRPRKLFNIFLAILVFFYALMAINIVMVNILKDLGRLDIFRYIQMEMLYGIGPALYFYTKSISNPKFKFTKFHYLHFLPLVFEFIFYRTSIYRIGSDGLYLEELPSYSYVYLTQQWIGILSILIYSFISLSILIKYQKQLKEYYSKIEHLSLKWLQAPVIIFGSYFMLWNILTEIDRFAFDGNLREHYFLPNFVILSIVTCWIGFKGYIQKELDIVQLQPVLRKSTPIEIEKDEAFLLKMKQLMENQKPYLNQELNLSILAESLQMKPKELSLKINQNYNKNFYDIINFYRIQAFKSRLKSSERDKMSLLGHAYECGFNSKSTFNLVFKKTMQQTPSEYLKKLKNTSS
ncbi:AraC family transcriptional regulator [Aquimarina sp. BL5]|uniref:helix-turn-helix domain-containing protein n=1 Tax=Aquimarina sp. BL5 TaxID=1714860 RepID=UPI000E4F6388|nr:AraC family transcriptional regulator [Aquimarina sp. BL5]AXT49567.1 AraC family transcriptional regulator [Aquimarina sp. BL5]RKM91343.1 helix-turn-helix domain-containing protein [Aquimarina sp. BL5]